MRLILKVWGGNIAAKYNRYVITDPTRFQDHRHRPLGHPSASKIRPEFARFGRTRLRSTKIRVAQLPFWAESCEVLVGQNLRSSAVSLEVSPLSTGTPGLPVCHCIVARRRRNCPVSRRPHAKCESSVTVEFR